ncbi:MAG: hypothetical protein Q8934_18805 [Bacillota bacterium]|nr:hypothetical protein [Bacillota bacterium]
MKITFKGETFNRFVDNELIFDKIFSLHDRLVLVTMPEESTLDVIGMSALRTTCGITRLGKRFSTNEPFCCSLFFVENAIDLVTFSFNNPEKLLEFYK